MDLSSEPLPGPVPPSELPNEPVPVSAPGPPHHPAGLPPLLWPDDLHRAALAEPSWLWHGYLVRGGVTLLTSQWKSGKTTLVSVLLARLGQGGVLAGQAVAPGRAVVVSEESPEQWELRRRRLGFGPHLCWLCRPFRGKPKPDEWLALVGHLAGLRERHGLTLAVFDPLASVLPGREENSAGVMLEALAPLQRLTTAGMAVLLLHHPRKQAAAAGMAARGSGALSGFVDIVIEMDWYRAGAEDDRRRRLRAYSRYEATPGRLVIELNADGTDYAALGDFHEEEFTASWEALRRVLEETPRKLTRDDVLKRWPAEEGPPDATTLWRWLQRGVSLGWLQRDGTGRRNNPYRYWLPGREKEWPELPPLGELPPLEGGSGVPAGLLDELRRRLKARRK